MQITPFASRGTPEWDALAAISPRCATCTCAICSPKTRTGLTTMTVEAADLVLDYSKNRLTAETVRLLVAVAERAGLRERIEAMFSGEHINVTEDRAVLHVALRAPEGTRDRRGGHNVVPDVHKVLDKMAGFRRGRPQSGNGGDLPGKQYKEHRQYRHRGLGPRAGHGLRGSCCRSRTER